MSRINRVKEIFQQEREKNTTKEPEPVQEHVVVDVIPEPSGPPPPLPELPEPTTHDTLHTTVSTTPARVITNRYGKKTVQWTPLKMLKPGKILEICTWTMMLTTMALEFYEV